MQRAIGAVLMGLLGGLLGSFDLAAAVFLATQLVMQP